MQKLTDQGYPALLCAITNRNDKISSRLQYEVEPNSDFLEKNPVCHAQYRSKYTNRKTVDQRKKQVCEIARHFIRSRMLHWIRHQCFNNTVVDIAACQLQGRIPHLWKSRYYQGWQIPHYDLHLADRSQCGIMQKRLEVKIYYTRFVVLTTGALTWWQTIFSTTESAWTPASQYASIHRKRHAQVLTQVHVML